MFGAARAWGRARATCAFDTTRRLASAAAAASPLGRAPVKAALAMSAGCAALAMWREGEVCCAASKPVDKGSLRGKVALVTGATGSIGSAVARDLAMQGCSIAVVDLNESKCEEVAAGLPTKSIGLAIDVSSEESVKAGYARIANELGAVDIVVNVAGILSNNKVFETTAEEWRRVHAINYDSCFYLSKACIPHMKEQGWGRVVNLTSWAWKSGGLTAGTAYSASKGALVGLTFSLARQFAGDGVTVNGVAPCYVMSPMIMEQAAHAPKGLMFQFLSQLTAEKRAELLEAIPVKRFCTPDEVAHAVVFLCSPLSGFITGEIIDMNGGFQMD